MQDKEQIALRLVSSNDGGANRQFPIALPLPPFDASDSQQSASAAAEIARLRAENADLKTTLERKRIAIQGAEMGVWELATQEGEDGLYVSPSAISLLGCASPLQGSCYDVVADKFDAADLKRIAAALKRYIVRPSGDFVAEARVESCGGEKKWWLIRAVVTETVGGNRRGARRAARIVGSVVDITRRRMRRRRASSESEAWHRSRCSIRCRCRCTSTTGIR